MPIFELETNVSRESAKFDPRGRLASTVAELLGVQTENMCVVVRYGVDVAFAQFDGDGKDKPCGNAKVISLKGLSAPTNKKISAAVSAILEEALGVPKDRFYIIYYFPGGGHNCGFNGGTFEGFV